MRLPVDCPIDAAFGIGIDFAGCNCDSDGHAMVAGQPIGFDFAFGFVTTAVDSATVPVGLGVRDLDANRAAGHTDGSP